MEDSVLNTLLQSTNWQFMKRQAIYIGHRLIILLVVWKVWWFVAYHVFGIYVGYITLNNGILFNQVEWSTKRFRITASSVRLRLWGNSKKFIILDLNVEILANRKKKSKLVKSYHSEVSTSPLSIYPKNRVCKFLFAWILKILPSVDIELKSAMVNHSKLWLDLDSLRIQMKIRESSYEKGIFRNTILIAGKLLESKIGVLKNQVPLSMGLFSMLIDFSIHKSSGKLSKISSRIYLEDLKLNVFQATKALVAQAPRKSTSSSHSLDEIQPQLDLLATLHNKFFESFQEFSVNISNSQVDGIPLFPASDNCSLTEYLDQEEPESSLRFSVKSASFHLARVVQNAAGFDVLFDHSIDKPIELTFSALLLKLYFVTRKYTKVTNRHYHDADEFFNFPNCTFTFKSNVTDHLAKGYGFRNCVIELFLTGSSPMLDVDAELFALLAYNYVVVRKLIKLRKMRQSKKTLFMSTKSLDSSDFDSGDDTKVADSQPGTPSKSISNKANPVTQIVDKAVSLLNEYYPKIDVKFTVEQPRAVIRIHDGKSTQMLMLSFSTIFLHVMTTDSDNYIAKCHLLHPCLTLSERCETESGNSHYQEEFCGGLHARLRVDVMKNLKFKISSSVSGAFISLAEPNALIGINSIIKTATKVVNKNMKHGLINIHYDAEIVKERELNLLKCPGKQQEKEITVDCLFNSLPSWLVEFEFTSSDLSVQLGYASPLLPPELISKLSEVASRTVDDTKSILSFFVSEFRYSLLGSDLIESQSTNSSSSLDTLTEDNSKQAYWKISTSTREVTLCLIENGIKSTPILNVPMISSSLSAVQVDAKHKIFFDIDVDEVLGFIDRYRVFVMVGLVYLLMVTIIEPLQKLRDKILKSTATLRLQQDKESNCSIQQYLICDFNIHRANYIAALSDSFKIRLQLYTLGVEINRGIIVITNGFAGLLADSPIMNGYWNRLMCLDALNVKINDPGETQKIVLQTSSLRFIQPHRFVVYKLFDNLGVFIKITKHLVQCLKSDKKDTIVYPKESKPLKIPTMKVKANKLTFTIEDDPFEAELNMIYQLGLQEQRKRLEIMDLFEEKCKHSDQNEEEYQERLELAQKTIELLWIRKIQVYKAKMAEEIINDREFLFGSELKIPETGNHRVTSYNKQAPLLHMIMSDLDLDLSAPKFPVEKLSEYIYEYGQQVPMDTRYSLMIPTHMIVAVDEVRMHMRDYPLPLLYLPKSTDAEGKGKALIMQGHLVISEALILKQEHLRRLEMQLIKNAKHRDSSAENFHKLIIEKSLSSVKLYTDLDVLLDSRAPARFVWGQSYQSAIQQIMLNVDQFSKPPVDPSPKLGFWDKMRLIMHGKCTIRTGQNSSIEVALKGGGDPYNLFERSSGFILSFKDQVRWNVNENDDPLNFFNILAKKVSWYIPNYLSAPLVCWCRESSKPTYFPATDQLINSCYAYYLNEIPDVDIPAAGTSDNKEKGVVELSGGVQFILGFLLQRKTLNDEGVTDKCKPHWDVEMWNPEYTEEGHDSYKGFRSDRLHMAISLFANNENNYNTIHLTPGVFKQFFSWWTLFHGNMMLPIRRGKMFGETKKSTKFSEHLFTIKYLFSLRNLFISHILRGQALDDSEDFFECVGLRAKVDEFLVDLHQRKEERIDEHEGLSRQKKVLKMSFNKGEVSLTRIDLRAMYAKFTKELYQQNHTNLDENCKYSIFDDDYQWFDSHDFDEAFIPSSGGRKTIMEALPLLYSEKFSYIRDTTNDNTKVEWGNEKTHDCMLNHTDIYSTQIGIYQRRVADLEDGLKKSETNRTELSAEILERINTLNRNIKIDETYRKKVGRKDSITNTMSSAEHFHNRFVLISMFFKWNEAVRNLFMKYIHFVQRNSNFRKYLSYEFMSMLDTIVKKGDAKCDDDLSLASSFAYTHHSIKKLQSFLNKFQSSQERLDNFDEIIRQVQDTEMVMENYKVEIISPQIQLYSEADKKSIVLVTAPTFEAKILSVVTKKDIHLTLNAKELETRYGVLLHDACVMVLDKKSVKSRDLLLEKQPYGTTSIWPPFLGIEVCKDNSLAPQEDILIKQMSLMLTYDQVKALGSSIDKMEGSTDAVSHTGTVDDTVDDRVNRLRVDCPELIINCTSKQYFTLYITLLNLLLYSEPMSVHLREKLSKLKFSINFQDFSALHHHLLGLHSYLGETKSIIDNYSFRHASKLDNEALNEFLFLHSEQQNISTEIILILQTLFSGDVIADSSAQPMEDWRIAADQIVLHMLTDEREPILDFKIDRGVCKRIVKEDGSNNNRIEIKSIEGVNRIEGAYYDKILAPISLPDHDQLITVDWSMNRAVGGIKIIENFEISSKPLNVKIDEVTGRLLMKFIFQTDEGENIESSPVMSATERKQAESNSEIDCELNEDAIDEKVEDKDNNEEDAKKLSEAAGRSKRDSFHSREVHFRTRSQSLSASGKLKKKPSTKDSSLTSGSESAAEFDDDVTEMIKRSKKYFTIVSMTSHSFELMISLRLKKGLMRWLNVTNFNLALPEWHIEREVMSMFNVVGIFKKAATKALLQHSGLIIKNKLSTRGTNAKHKLKRST